MTRARLHLSLATTLVCLLALVGAACGGNDATDAAGTAATQAEGQADTALGDAGTQALLDETTQLDLLIDETIADLRAARSIEDVEEDAQYARDELEAARDRLEALQLEGEAAQRRDDLVREVGELQGELAELDAAVRARDLPAALRGVSTLSIGDVQAELERIEQELGS
ncbi:MAG TPA: hypothetical protein VM204_06835 [Gaiellaceae bacterium]|nr:hypothetical protein [Gaiellaceae bacterium]